MASKSAVPTKKQGISKMKILAVMSIVLLATVFCYYSLPTTDIPEHEDKAMSENGIPIPIAKLEAGIPAAEKVIPAAEKVIPAAEKVIPAPSPTLSYPTHSDSVHPVVKVANDTELRTETPISKTLPYAGDDNSLMSPPDSYCGIYADFLEGTLGGMLCNKKFSLAEHEEFKSHIARITKKMELKDKETTRRWLITSCAILHNSAPCYKVYDYHPDTPDDLIHNVIDGSSGAVSKYGTQKNLDFCAEKVHELLNKPSLVEDVQFINQIIPRCLIDRAMIEEIALTGPSLSLVQTANDYFYPGPR